MRRLGLPCSPAPLLPRSPAPMLQLTHNTLTYFQFNTLAGDGNVRHAVFSRQGGVSPAPFDSLNLSVSVPDEKSRVYANRRRAYGLYGRDTATVVHSSLVHGNNVQRVDSGDNGRWRPDTDAIITDENGCALTMNYADCAPIFLYDPIHGAIGLGHSGWQGTVKDVPGAMVSAMRQEFGSNPADLLAGIGPCIGVCCYEVDEPLVGQVRAAFDTHQQLLIPQPNTHRPHFDLALANAHNFARAGVTQIEQSGLCTACRTDLFFSHRAEHGKTGRFGTIFILGE